MSSVKMPISFFSIAIIILLLPAFFYYCQHLSIGELFFYYESPTSPLSIFLPFWNKCIKTIFCNGRMSIFSLLILSAFEHWVKFFYKLTMSDLPSYVFAVLEQMQNVECPFFLIMPAIKYSGRFFLKQYF